MADQDRGRAMRFAQMICCSDQIVNVRRKMRIGKFASAAAESSEIETQHADAVHRQPLRDALGGRYFLATGKGMSKQRKGHRLAERKIEYRRESLALRPGKIEPCAAN